MYVFVCKNCTTGKHDQCEISRDKPPVREGHPEVTGGGMCVCPHDANYATPEQVWLAQKEKDGV
jgi:hypothetical protein